jgi:hypothetical protein
MSNQQYIQIELPKKFYDENGQVHQELLAFINEEYPFTPNKNYGSDSIFNEPPIKIEVRKKKDTYEITNVILHVAQRINPNKLKLFINIQSTVRN